MDLEAAVDAIVLGDERSADSHSRAPPFATAAAAAAPAEHSVLARAASSAVTRQSSSGGGSDASANSLAAVLAGGDAAAAPGGAVVSDSAAQLRHEAVLALRPHSCPWLALRAGGSPRVLGASARAAAALLRLEAHVTRPSVKIQRDASSSSGGASAAAAASAAEGVVV